MLLHSSRKSVLEKQICLVNLDAAWIIIEDSLNNISFLSGFACNILWKIKNKQIFIVQIERKHELRWKKASK